MPQYQVRYLSATPQGGRQLREVVIEASDQHAVAAALAVRPADIVGLRSLDAAVPGQSGASAARRHKSFPLRFFSQELAVLLEAGIPLYEALATLRDKDANGATHGLISDLIGSLEHGMNFAQALREHPAVFSSLFIASIEASQRTGQMAQALRGHADYLTWLESLRDKLVSALIYPLILICAGTLVMLFLTMFVVPRFAQIYKDLGGDLPWMSRALLGVGQTVGQHPLVVVVVLVGVMAGVFTSWRSPALRAKLTASLWRLPYVGDRLRLVELSALYRTLGMLLEAGVAVVPALQASAELMGPALRGALADATQMVNNGARLSESLDACGLTTPVSQRMMRVGEQSGELGRMLERAARFYDEDLARFSDWVGRVVSPVLMLVMGVLIGGVVVMMYLPIFQVAEQIR